MEVKSNIIILIIAAQQEKKGNHLCGITCALSKSILAMIDDDLFVLDESLDDDVFHVIILLCIHTVSKGFSHRNRLRRIHHGEALLMPVAVIVDNAPTPLNLLGVLARVDGAVGDFETSAETLHVLLDSFQIIRCQG